MVSRSTIIALKCVSASLSVLGAGSILVNRFTNPKRWKPPARRLLWFLSFADLGTAIFYMLPASTTSDPRSTVCVAQSLGGMYFPLASFFLTDSIAFYVFMVVCGRGYLYRHGSIIQNHNRLFTAFHVVSWGVPLLLTMTVFWTGHSGYDQDSPMPWCWVRYSGDDTADDDSAVDKRAKDVFIWQFVGGKGVELFSFLVWCPILYAQTLRHISLQEHWSRQVSMASSGSGSFNEQETYPYRLQPSQANDNGPVTFTTFKWKLFLVPIIFFALRIWSSFRTLLYFFTENDHHGSFWFGFLEVMQTICDPAQGFFNGILFMGFSRHSPDDDRDDNSTLQVYHHQGDDYVHLDGSVHSSIHSSGKWKDAGELVTAADRNKRDLEPSFTTTCLSTTNINTPVSDNQWQAWSAMGGLGQISGGDTEESGDEWSGGRQRGDPPTSATPTLQYIS